MRERRADIRTLLHRLCDSLDRIDRRLAETPADAPALIDLNAAAKKLGISLSSMERMVAKKQIESVKIGGRRLVPVDAIKRISGA